MIMDQLTWRTDEAARRGLLEIEHRITGGLDFASYLAQLQCNGQAQCTTVWTKTTIAYRCKTCQVNDSSAICVSCFQAGDHRHHDYVMYKSDSGGCCDCGDHAAWKEEGFCTDHSRFQPRKELPIPLHLKDVTCQAVQFVLKELSLWVEMIMEAKTVDRSPPSLEPEMAETYVIWLQKVCSVAALRTVLCKQIICPPYDKDCLAQNSKCFLDSLLSTYARMPEPLMEAETTLFLQMLYDQRFKDNFSRALMRHYPSMILPAAVVPGLLTDYKALDQSLDRVMVQLFNVPETTLNLIQTDHLLECVTSVLGSIVSYCINTDTGTVNMNHPAIKEKIYGRPQGDLKLILVHESVALHVLKDRPDVFQTILSIWSMLQWMNPYVQSEPVDFEEEVSWTQAITLEMNVMAIAFGLISRCFSAFAASADSSRSGLLSAACLTMTALREFLSKVKDLKGSPDTVSLHIPLHRTFCAIISKLVMMPWEDSRDGFLGKLQPAFATDEVLALMDHPLRVTVWMAQIRAQMWRNTSEDFSRLELIYRGSIWHAQSMDMDIFMLQFCSVALENMEQSVFLTIAQKFNLLELVTMPTNVGSSKWLLLPTNVSMIHDFLRLLLLIVRERRNTGMSEKESLRSDVIQWLCVCDQTYSQLAFRLSGILIDQSNLSSVLEEVAIYNDPKLQERGYYQLKPECWKEFDPLFAHFYLNDVEEAQERALSVGKLPHYWRLQTPREAKPPFNRLIRLLHSQACHHLIWNVLHSVTILIRDEVTATSAEALGVMILQILGMALIDTRVGVANLHTEPQARQMESSSSHDSSGILTFIYSKPSSNQEPGSLDWDQEDLSCNYLSIYEMLSDLHQVKDSFRLVDLVSYVLRLLNPCSIPNSSFEPSSPQPLQAADAGNDAEQRKLKKQRQDAILATFAARQKEFLENVLDDEPEKEPEGAKGDIVWSTAGASETPALTMLEDKMSVGKELPNRDLHECAFCRSECDSEESPTGWIALVQRFNLLGLSQSKGQALSTVNEVTSLVLDTQAEVPDMITVVAGSSKADESAFGSLDPHATEHIRCCGHQMHQMCFQRYAESLIRRHYARSTYEGKGIIDLAKMEFLCPICRRLANVLVPDVNKAVPWMRLPVCGEDNSTEVLFKENVQCSEGLALFKLESLVPYGSSELYDVQYWKDYWHSHETLAESIGLFVSQCLRVRKTFLKGPPDFEVLSLCQVLWETFAENISHCEVETREGPSMKDVVASAGSSSSEDGFLWRGDAAHWRALLELGNLAMLTNTMPCTGKYQRRLQLLRWIGFEETIIDRLKDDTVMNFSDGSQFDEAIAKSGCQQEHHNQHKSEKVHGVSESFKLEKSNQKDFEKGQACMAKDVSVEDFGDHKEKQTDTFKISLADSKASGLRRLFRGQEQGDILEEEPSSVGWLWNESSSSSCGALASGDPFELLMMLLVTVEGCPTFEDIMTMARVTYVLAATQASVAFDKLLRHDGDDILPSAVCKDKVLELACLPFLRRVALLVQIVTERNVVGNKGGEEFASMDSSRLLQWMHLPNVQDAVKLGFQSNHGVNMLQRWQNSQVAPMLFRTPRRILLTKLPEVFQELVLQNLNISCGQCHRPPREPAICLVCGDLFCCGTECCTVDNMGECYRHADKESAGVGLYLLMRSTRLVILRSNRVCMAPSLYLDLHGEEDAYLKRGHPLHLSHLRLNEIRRLWLTAAFDHDTHILHTSQIGGKVL